MKYALISFFKLILINITNSYKFKYQSKFHKYPLSKLLNSSIISLSFMFIFENINNMLEKLYWLSKDLKGQLVFAKLNKKARKGENDFSADIHKTYIRTLLEMQTLLIGLQVELVG